LALAVYGLPRATEDIDTLIRDEDLERVKKVVAPLGFKLHSGIIPFKTGTPEEQKLFPVTKTDDEDFLVLDLILVTPVLREAWKNREVLDMVDRKVQVVSKIELIRMKQRAGRPQDLLDIEKLNTIQADE
jgi:hypothetical protein